MRRSRNLVAVMATAVVAALAACSLEVNVQVDRDEEGVASIDAGLSADFPANPFRSDKESMPRVRDLDAVPLPPERDAVVPSAPAVPLPPAPPLFQAPVPTVVDGAVRDALWRRDLNVESKWVEIPQPPESEVGPGDGPRFTPFTVAPRIENKLGVVEALERAYPRGLKEAGIGGTVRVYFFIDADGTVGQILMDQASRHRAIDRAAMQVASEYRFHPALNRGEPVAVWVSFPITFRPE